MDLDSLKWEVKFREQSLTNNSWWENWASTFSCIHVLLHMHLYFIKFKIDDIYIEREMKTEN